MPRSFCTSAWSRIWRPLRQAMPDALYHDAKTLLRIEQHPGGVAAIFAGAHLSSSAMAWNIA